jgi:RNA recognition motif-containing protein
MSTDTHNSPKQGDSRRRRSRGGQNRNNNNSNRGNNDGRQSSGGNRSSHNSSGQSQQRRAMPAPQKTLSLWQKILKAFGLYKEPVRPPRPERRPSAVETKQNQEPRRNKTRDARTDQGNRNESRDQGDSKKQPREPREQREPRERSNKNSNRSRGGDPSTVENRRVYVGNLSYDTTESDLEELFKGVGAVRRVEIVYNRSTHRSKGYGFIEMLDIDEAKRTVEVLHDQFFMGRQITVSGAKSKDYDDAEKEEGGNTATVAVVPQLAPINPQKEEVLNLIDEPVTQASAEVSNPEVPTEEFHSEVTAPEAEKEEEAKA